MPVIGIVLLVCAAILLIVGGVAAMRKLPGNNVIGLRVEEVRESREVWDLAHAVSGPVWMLGGAALAFGALLAMRAEGWMWVLPIISVFIAVLAISVGSNLGARAAYLAAEKNREDAKPKVDLGALRTAVTKADEK